jgi:prevent-host-death family protein
MIDNLDNLVSITDAKATLPEIVRKAADGTDTVLLRHGHPTAVVVGIARLNALLEEIEDLEDRLSVYESRDHVASDRVPLEKVLTELGLHD